MNINNKIKNVFTRDGGYDNGKKLNLKDLENLPETPKHGKKKKRKNKVFIPFHHCPFCFEELPIIKEEEEKIAFQGLTRSWWNRKRATTCKCGANEVADCPACHRKTWFKDGKFKHNKYFLNCGFEGERK
jgi:hypothetical protein